MTLSSRLVETIAAVYIIGAMVTIVTLKLKLEETRREILELKAEKDGMEAVKVSHETIGKVIKIVLPGSAEELFLVEFEAAGHVYLGAETYMEHAAHCPCRTKQ